MIINKKFLYIAAVISGAILSGCASNLNQVQSGFLGDYSKLKSSKDYDNTKIFQTKDFDQDSLAAIKEIKLVPFEIWIKPTQKNNTTLLNAARLQELSTYFHKKLKVALKNDYSLVNVSNQNTLTIQGAFSNIKLSEPE
jgi:hypothetical protein